MLTMRIVHPTGQYRSRGEPTCSMFRFLAAELENASLTAAAADDDAPAPPSRELPRLSVRLRLVAFGASDVLNQNCFVHWVGAFDAA
jgi:hypothetical protein